MTKPRFITLEGAEGVGKSSAVKAISGVLADAGIDFIVTREPGGSAFAEEIRHLTLKKGNETISPMTELLLMFACREQNIQEVLKPALAAGKWVICDRFTDASFAYQGGGRGIPRARIQALADWIQADLVPDMTVLLDAPVEVGLGRLTGDRDRIEEEEAAFFRRVRDVYLSMAKAEPTRYRVIDASQPIDIVQDNLRSMVRQLI